MFSWPKIRHMKFRKGMAVLFVCLLLLTIFSIPVVRASLISCLIPGDKAVTVTAFLDMTEAVRDGQSVPAAFTQFCRDVVDGA